VNGWYLTQTPHEQHAGDTNKNKGIGSTPIFHLYGFESIGFDPIFKSDKNR
jgi:hypothetical protein